MKTEIVLTDDFVYKIVKNVKFVEKDVVFIPSLGVWFEYNDYKYEPYGRELRHLYFSNLRGKYSLANWYDRFGFMHYERF